MNYHEDDRAQRLLDVFPLDKGQVNISYINSTEHIVAWHKHNEQTDYFLKKLIKNETSEKNLFISLQTQKIISDIYKINE